MIGLRALMSGISLDSEAYCAAVTPHMSATMSEPSRPSALAILSKSLTLLQDSPYLRLIASSMPMVSPLTGRACQATRSSPMCW